MQPNTFTLCDREVIDTSEMTEDQFRAFRSDKIGGSDMAAICGINPFKSKFQLFLEKMGLVPPATLNAAMQDGHIYEPLLIAEWQRRYPTLRVFRNLCFIHPDRPYMIANVDAVAVNGTIKVVIEAKKAGDRSIKMYGLPGGEEIPHNYYVQVQQYLGIVKRLWDVDAPCDLIVKDPTKVIEESPIYTLKLDLSVFEALEGYAEEFHERMELNDPPEVDDREETEKYLRRLHPRHTETSIEVIPEVDMAVEVYRELKRREKTIAEEMQKAKNHIIQYMGPNALLTKGGIPILSYKANKDSQRTDWKGICEELQPSQEIIDDYTETSPGARTLRLMGEKA